MPSLSLSVQLERFKLPYPEAIFEIGYFRTNPAVSGPAARRLRRGGGARKGGVRAAHRAAVRAPACVHNVRAAHFIGVLAAPRRRSTRWRRSSTRVATVRR